MSSKDTKSEKVNLHAYQRGGTNRRVCYLARRNKQLSLSPHFNNFDSPLTGPELADSLKTVSSRIRSIIYCQRTETSNIYRDLKNAGLPVVDVGKDIASRKGDISEELEQLYKRLHRPSALELKTFYIVLRYDGYEQKICKKKTRLSARRRRNFKLKKLANQELFSIPENFRIYLNPGQARKVRKAYRGSDRKPFICCSKFSLF